jgi:hypothetical protein
MSAHTLQKRAGDVRKYGSVMPRTIRPKFELRMVWRDWVPLALLPSSSAFTAPP